MSLGALPTELDVAIIRYLKCSDISSLSRSSKYYRDTSEPLLYESIHFWTDEHIELKKLFLTLVSRKSLRTKILQFGIHHEPDPQASRRLEENGCYEMDNAGFELCEDLVANAKEIHTIVSDLTTQHEIASQLNMSTFAKVFEPPPQFDGCLALLLCMATQLRTLHLDLHGEALKTTELVLTTVDWRYTHSTSGDQPLQALRGLCMQAAPPAYGRMPLPQGFRVPFLHTLEDLTIRNNRQLCLSGFDHGLPAALNTLTLQDVYFHPSSLRRILRLPSSQTIERLTISGIANVNMISIWTAGEYHKLKATLLEYLPDLRYFQWTAMKHWGNVEPFGSFSEFNKLEELVIDSDALSSYHSLLKSDQPVQWNAISDLLPPNLAILELLGFPWDQFRMAYTQYCDSTHCEIRSEELPRLYALIASPPMKEICLNVTFTKERHGSGCGVMLPAADDRFLEFLKSTSERLERLGTKFTV